jgi:hypothetical protein
VEQQRPGPKILNSLRSSVLAGRKSIEIHFFRPLVIDWNVFGFQLNVLPVFIDDITFRA